MGQHEPVRTFEEWYDHYDIDERTGCLEFRQVSAWGGALWSRYEKYKREMDQRVSTYWKLEKLADGEVVSTKPDLPNISSGETAGLIRRMARNLVQNAPNVEIICKFDDDSVEGLIARFILMSKIIGVDEYSNDMQQNLFASTKTALTLGFDSVVPALLQSGSGAWYMKYDALHYRDVFPEPGAKDVRQANDVFVRRYLTKGDVKALIAGNVAGWDHAALRDLLKSGRPPAREQQSASHQDKKHHIIPDGYEVITWYSNTGEPFLTFSASTKALLRIEKNKHPVKEHPVHFLVLEKDSQQPLGKSMVELLFGRQEFQDLMFNGAMKLWYRNINPSIIGYGTVNSIPNLSPGKYTQISNPNAKIEAFEVNTQTLLQYGQISQQNLGSMVQTAGAADQQMAQQNGAGGGMSATPQGVEAQQAMVDITTNNYQKAIESFFSHYCSYALTLFFQEMKSVKEIHPNAEARVKLKKLDVDNKLRWNDDGTCLYIDFDQMATEYYVRCVPGSLVEMEDEKQLRILNQLFVPLSQAMPAMAATQDQDMLRQATQTMAYIIKKQIELSGSASARDIAAYWEGNKQQVDDRDARIAATEGAIGEVTEAIDSELDITGSALLQMQEQLNQNTQVLSLLLEKLGVSNEPSTDSSNTAGVAATEVAPAAPSVTPATA
jgi:hypothetical protein